MWLEVATVIGVNIGLFAFIATLLMWAVNKLDTDIKGVREDVKALSNRMDGHAARIDQLYSIILTMLKEGKR